MNTWFVARRLWQCARARGHHVRKSQAVRQAAQAGPHQRPLPAIDADGAAGCTRSSSLA